MADPLSVVSAITGLLFASAKVTKAVYKFQSGFKDAPEDVKQLITMLESIKSILSQLEDALKPNASADIKLPDGVKDDLMKMIGNCNGIYDRLLKLTTEYCPCGKREEWERMMWVMVGQEEARKLREMLVTHNLTLSITLQWTNHITPTAMKREMREGFDDVRNKTGHIRDVMEELCAKLASQHVSEPYFAIPGVDHFLKSATSYTSAQPPPYSIPNGDATPSKPSSDASLSSPKGKEKGAPATRTLRRVKTGTNQSSSASSTALATREKPRKPDLVSVHQETDLIRSILDPMTEKWKSIEQLPEPFDEVLSRLAWGSSKLFTFQFITTKQNPIHVPVRCSEHAGMAMKHMQAALGSFMALGQHQAQIAFVFSMQVQQAPRMLREYVGVAEE